MRFVTATGFRRAELQEEESADLTEGCVRISVEYVGVCHSDLGILASRESSFPQRLGHEVAGVIVESRADGLSAGARVAALVQDGYATEIVCGAEDVVLLSEGCSLLDAALSEPLACVIGGLERISWRDADRVVVVGAGFMGLLATWYLASRGLHLTVIEPRESARTHALRLGAAVVAEPADVPGGNDRLWPVVVEATGNQAGLALAGSLVETDGVLGILGYHQSNGGERTVPMQTWNYRALRVLSLHNRDPRRTIAWMDRAQRMSALGIIRPSELVDRIVALDELTDVLANGTGPDTIKLAVSP